METQENSALIQPNDLIEASVCRRCIYLLKKGEEVSLTIFKNGDSLCSHCGKKRDAPYKIKVKVISLSEDTGKSIQIKAQLIEMPNNWNGRGKQIFPQ